MTAATDKINLLGMSHDLLAHYLDERGETPFRARQILQWIHQRGDVDVDEMTHLAMKFRESMIADTEIVLPSVQ